MTTLTVNDSTYEINKVQGDKRTDDDGNPTKHTLTFEVEEGIDQQLLDLDGDVSDVEAVVEFEVLPLKYVGRPKRVALQVYEGTEANKYGDTRDTIATVSVALICDIDAYNYVAV